MRQPDLIMSWILLIVELRDPPNSLSITWDYWKRVTCSTSYFQYSGMRCVQKPMFYGGTNYSIERHRKELMTNNRKGNRIRVKI